MEDVDVAASVMRSEVRDDLEENYLQVFFVLTQQVSMRMINYSHI